MNKERFSRLYYFMRDKVPAQHFNIDSLVYGVEEGVIVTDHLKETLAAGENCGTTACFAGWCPVIFPEDWRWVRKYQPIYDGAGSWFQSFRDFFDITEDETDLICCMDHYPEDQEEQLIFGLANMREVASRYGLVLEKIV